MLETGQVAITQVVLQQISQFSHLLAIFAKQYGWRRTGQFFDLMSQNIGYGIYGYRAYQQGIARTSIAVATGIATEKCVERIGKSAIDRFFNSFSQVLRSKRTKPSEIIPDQVDDLTSRAEESVSSLSPNSL